MAHVDDLDPIEHDHEDGCLCEAPASAFEITDDIELPQASEGSSPAVADGEDNDDGDDGDQYTLTQNDITQDEELPAAFSRED